MNAKHGRGLMKKSSFHHASVTCGINILCRWSEGKMELESAISDIYSKHGSRTSRHIAIPALREMAIEMFHSKCHDPRCRTSLHRRWCYIRTAPGLRRYMQSPHGMPYGILASIQLGRSMSARLKLPSVILEDKSARCT